MTDSAVARTSRPRAQPKSPIATALLNVLLPGSGHMYCGAWVLGLVILALALLLGGMTDGLVFAILLPLLVIDGFRVTEQANRPLQNPAPAPDGRPAPRRSGSD